MENIQKQIQIVDLKPVSGMKKDGSGMWNKYTIRGNDGLTYQTWDQAWFLQRKVGEMITIEFYTITRQNPMNGKMYTDYNLVIPTHGEMPNNSVNQPLPNRQNPGANSQVAAILAELKRVETNIIAAIRVHCGTNVNVTAKMATPPANAVPGIPIIEENGNGGYAPKAEEEIVDDNNPF